MRAVHIGQEHDAEDIRITRKEGETLVKEGIEVIYMTQEKNKKYSGELIRGIQTYTYGVFTDLPNIPFISWRIKRILSLRPLKKLALQLNGDIYHIHEVGLYAVARYLKCHGKKVIFDQHEDSPGQAYQTYLELFHNTLLAKLYKKKVIKKEKILVYNSDYIIATSEAIAQNIKKYGYDKKITVIHNYADKDSTSGNNDDYTKRDNVICYAGGLFGRRGIKYVVDAMDKVDGKFEIAGNLDENMQKQYESSKGWGKCKYLGMLTREEVNALYNRSRIGIINNLDIPYHRNSNPNKLFEYMAVGIPIVCTSIPTWAEIVKDANCGLIVDATDSVQIADAITYLLEHPLEAKEMGDNGKRAFEQKYNWDIEKGKLLHVYKEELF